MNFKKWLNFILLLAVSLQSMTVIYDIDRGCFEFAHHLSSNEVTGLETDNTAKDLVSEKHPSLETSCNDCCHLHCHLLSLLSFDNAFPAWLNGRSSDFHYYFYANTSTPSTPFRPPII